jgi:sugar O-acyltransferase (sialic acid O-acetyltransferase NeuD family)
MDKVIVFGNGQTASENYFYLSHDSIYKVAAFTVDRDYIKEDTFLGLPVVPFEDIESIYPPDEFKMSIFISYRKMNSLRAEKYGLAKEKGYQLIGYISSRANTWPGLVVGENSFIFENSVIGPFSKIGNNVVIAGSFIGHHCVIKDHCFVSPNAVVLGSTTIEPYCLIGANSTIRDGGITIARECIIGAGVYIAKDTKERGVYLNRPAELVPKPSNELGTWLTWPVR